MQETPTGLRYELTAGRGDVVMLSAGLGGLASFWLPQFEALAERYRLLLYDHRGTGRSDRELTEPHSVEAMADDILEVMDAAGVARAHLIGHAAGGLAGLAVALKAPKRLNKLVVVNGWAGPDPHIARCFEARLALLNDTGVAAYVRAQPLFLYPANWISEHSAKLAHEGLHHIAGFPEPEVMVARINALLAFDITERLGEIKTETLVYASADDMLVPSLCSERLAAGLPNATLEIAPWGGHAFTVTAPDAFNAGLLAWLDPD